MKQLSLLLFASVLFFSSCSKQVLVPENINVDEWIRTHERGRVAYVDYYSGNYIVETLGGYSVIEGWGGITPREYDTEYAYFSSRGIQTIYNYSGNYFSQKRVVDSWLSWYQAISLIDQMNYGNDF